jgi:hypothetical protein
VGYQRGQDYKQVGPSSTEEPASLNGLDTLDCVPQLVSYGLYSRLKTQQYRKVDRTGAPLSDNATYPANLCPIWCGGTMSLSKAGTTHSAQ